MKLEHFVFSVLYLEDFGDKGKQVSIIVYFSALS